MKIAITREISLSLNDCQLTHLERQPIDLQLARQQHHTYENHLAMLGCEIQRLPEQPDMPDAVFVEDVAIVLDEMGIMTCPGAESRRLEIPTVERALSSYRPIHKVQSPGTIEGGDVLKIDKKLFVGLSSRTNPEGIAQLESLVAPLGYAVVAVPVNGCLHLKSAVSQIAANTLLINPGWLPSSAFAGFELLEIDPSEPLAANALLLGVSLIYPAHFPRTRERIEGLGIQVLSVDVSELAKAEGGVTCCSLIFTA